MKIEKKYYLNGNLTDVQTILIDLAYYGKLHPLIKSTRKIGNDSEDYQEFRIKERPYNLIPITIEYSVRVKKLRDIVEYQITGIPFTKANIKYKLLQIEGKKTEVLFSLQLDGLSISNKILMNKMLAAQNQLIEAINQELLRQ